MCYDDGRALSRFCELGLQIRLCPIELQARVSGREAHAAAPRDALEIVHLSDRLVYRLVDAVDAEQREVGPQGRAEDRAARNMNALALEEMETSLAAGRRFAVGVDRAVHAPVRRPQR